MNLLRKRRGVSGIISGVFLVAVAVMVFNVLAWQFFQQDAYNRIEQEVRQREWERLSERIEISETGSGSYLRFKVSNIGGVTAHIVTVYLNDTTANSPKSYVLKDYITANCSAWISSAAERWIYTTIPLTADHVYALQISTERGNLAVAQKFNPTQTLTPGGYQPMPFIFGFGYNDFQYSATGPPQGYDWKPAWIVRGAPIKPWFRIFLNNTYAKAVKIVSISCLDAYENDNWGKRAYPLQSELIIEAKSGQWVIFNPSNDALGQGQYYVFVLVYYHFTDNPSQIFGSSVAVLACNVQAT